MLLIFDWDGTLADTEYKLSEKVALAASGAGFFIDASSVFQRFSGLGSSEKFKAIAAHCDRPIAAETITNLQTQHRSAKASLYSETTIDDIFSGIAPALALLQKKHTLAICSNGDLVPLTNAVSRTGLTCYFNDAIYTPKSLNVPSKPDPKMLVHALEHHKKSPVESLMVGDTVADMCASKAAGIPYRFAFISPHFTGKHGTDYIENMTQAGATHFFSDYKKLPGMIAGLN